MKKLTDELHDQKEYKLIETMKMIEEKIYQLEQLKEYASHKFSNLSFEEQAEIQKDFTDQIKELAKELIIIVKPNNNHDRLRTNLTINEENDEHIKDLVHKIRDKPIKNLTRSNYDMIIKYENKHGLTKGLQLKYFPERFKSLRV